MKGFMMNRWDWFLIYSTLIVLYVFLSCDCILTKSFFELLYQCGNTNSKKEGGEYQWFKAR